MIKNKDFIAGLSLSNLDEFEPTQDLQPTQPTPKLGCTNLA